MGNIPAVLMQLDKIYSGGPALKKTESKIEIVCR